MNRTDLRKRAYTAPWCKAIEMENEQFVCVVSVRPNGGAGSSNTPWDEKNHEGGTGFIGDESSVAPGKENNTWEEEE